MEPEPGMDGTHFKQQPYSQFPVTLAYEWRHYSHFSTRVEPHVCVCECVSIPTHALYVDFTQVHTHITGRIESVTRARFDFTPLLLLLGLSLGPSHKQSPGSKSRYEISFVGCWQVPHVCSLAWLVCRSTCVCVRVGERQRWKKERIITHTLNL